MNSSHTEDIRRLIEDALPLLADVGSGGRRSHAGSSTKHPDTKQLIKGLIDLYIRAGETLEGSAPQDFAKVWFLRNVVHELLQYTIEDDYIDISQHRAAILTALHALKDNHWFADNRLDSALAACRTIATKTPLNDIGIELKLNGVRVIGRMAPAGQPLIQVSSRAYPIVPILEDSITHPAYVKDVVCAYARQIHELQDRLSVNALCFVEKDVGPVGALSMISMLVQQISLPATIYRSKHWSTRAKVAAYKPVPSDRVVIVYDLLVTGDGIQQVARDLEDRFGTTVSAAVVLFGYETKRYELPFKSSCGVRSLAIRALGWYDDMAAEVDSVRHGKTDETAHIRRLINNPNNNSTHLRDHTEGIDSTKEEEMSMDSVEETLGLVIAGLEDFDRGELLEVAEVLFAGTVPTTVQNCTIRNLRRVLTDQANTLYHQQPQQLRRARKEVRRVALKTIAGLTKAR